MSEKLEKGLKGICNDFKEYFEKEVPENGFECLEWIREILELTKEVVEEGQQKNEKCL